MVNKLVKRMLSLTLAGAMVLTSMGMAPAKAKAAEVKEGWNIDIYMSASNLESAYMAGSEDLIEMMDAKNMPENVQITVQTGGSTAWHYDKMIKKYYKDVLGMTDETIAKIDIQNISNQYIQRWHIKYDNQIEQDGKTITYPSLVQISANEGVNDKTLAKELGVPQVSMGATETLNDFIKETVTEYKHNVIVFWNHGGGTAGGVCYDDLNGRDRLFLDEINDAMAANKAIIPNGGYDMVGFDACLMGNFESMAICSRYAKYLTASMTLEGDDGWEYTDAVTELGKAVTEGKEFTGGDLGKALIAPFAEHYTADKNNGYYYPDANLATVDLSYGPELVAEFNTMAKTMLHLCADNNMKKGFLGAAYKSVVANEGSQMVGMYTFLNNTLKYAKDYVAKNEAAKGAVVKENVANCNEFIEAASTLYNTLFEKTFFIDYFTGHESSDKYQDHAFSFFLPDAKNVSTAFSKNMYEALGISDYYAIFAYNVAVDVIANQNIDVTTKVNWNDKTQDYTLNVTSKNGLFTDACGVDVYAKYNKEWVNVRAYDGKMKDNKMTMAPKGGYLTFNGAPIWMSAYDEEYFNYVSYLQVNGERTGLEYDFDEAGNIVLFDDFEVGDEIVPYYYNVNGERVLAEEAKYVVKESDVAADGTVTLPFVYKEEKVSNLAYDYYLYDMVGGEHHNFFAHKDSVAFTGAKATLAKKTYLATGNEIKPNVTVKTKAGKKLVKDKDYKLVYSNNIAAGKATVKVIGIGKYIAAPVKTLTYTIKARKN